MKGRKLFVGNLTYSVNARQLGDLFSRYGVVTGVNVLEKKGYGFVEMKTPEEADKARNALSETEFEGRKLLIDGVRPPLRKKKSNPQPGTGRPDQRSSSRPGSSPGSGYKGKKPDSNFKRRPKSSSSPPGRSPSRPSYHQPGRARR